MRHVLIYRLRNAKREVERLIRDELRRPEPDGLRISALKRRKLALKDELFHLESGLVPVRI